MADSELTLSFQELISRRIQEHNITLTCVSNTLGRELIGNEVADGVRDPNV
ncbi:MAG: hypothetical protein ACI89G_001583 [Minisyncoccia bacterium]|jgi:hypothetical protein